MKNFMRLIGVAAMLVVNVAMAAVPVTLYKSPDCTCCEKYVSYLKANGFAVKVVESHDMPVVKKQLGSDKLSSCHTMTIDGYVVEGHVPVAAIRKLLQQRPAIVGISVPSMPTNAPGMGPEVKGTLKVVQIEKQPAAGAARVFSIE